MSIFRYPDSDDSNNEGPTGLLGIPGISGPMGEMGTDSTNWECDPGVPGVPGCTEDEYLELESISFMDALQADWACPPIEINVTKRNKYFDRFGHKFKVGDMVILDISNPALEYASMISPHDASKIKHDLDLYKIERILYVPSSDSLRLEARSPKGVCTVLQSKYYKVVKQESPKSELGVI